VAELLKPRGLRTQPRMSRGASSEIPRGDTKIIYGMNHLEKMIFTQASL